MRMRTVLVVLVSIAPLAAGCANDGDTDPGPDEQVPATCPSTNVEVCGYRDGPWEVDCEYGAVTLHDSSTMLYCDPPNTAILCESDPPGPRILTTCDSCSDEVKLFDTYDEFQRFDPASLCL